MGRTNPSALGRQRRKVSIRKRVHGTPERPRLTVFRSANHIYAQVVDDEAGCTLAAASTLGPAFAGYEGHRGNVDAARIVGRLIAEAALSASVNQVVFDRNGYLFHGRVKALADAAREAGLQF